MKEGGFYFLISKGEPRSLKYNLDAALRSYVYLKNMIV